ncbi:WhiB family transcriptional regulator [Gordonia tangerina]|uniref:Transcriptional regulator WhiB n=1 Tax=Gordonia tangerina TaxID=2911060 RepID=A0ABS9DPS4_9ACTN|nr:WhiB family transcriptional regulator [Gordonia tangerina]MCF3939946.1 WhiB family transcriptional regulator [Gordonia tangerina]
MASSVESRMAAILESLPRVPEWMALGRCGAADPDSWFPEKNSAAAAKAVCRNCEVVEQCLSYALDNNEPHGVWGGKSVRERARMRRDGRAA